MLGIDHPLVLVRDIGAAAAAYRRLGFQTAPEGRHPWGTSTCLVMFERSAIELMGVADASFLDSHAIGTFRFGRHMAEALAEREGVALVALYSADAAADRARVAARGIAGQGRVAFRRRVKVPGREWDEAVVSLEILLDPALPRGSHFICQQHRPELVWVPEWLVHANGALGFAGLTYAAREPGPLLDRLERLFGGVRQTALGHAVSTGRGEIRVVAPGVWSGALGIGAEPTVGDAAACVGMDVRVADLAHVARLLGAAGVAFVAGPDGGGAGGGLALPELGAYGNVVVRFVEAG